jgi:hypothetical protein
MDCETSFAEWWKDWCTDVKHQRGINVRKLLNARHGWAESSIGSWTEYGDNGRFRGHLPYEAVEQAIRDTDDIRPFEEMGRRLGVGVWRLCDPRRMDDRIPRGLKELNDLVQAIYEAERDGVITQAELVRIKREGQELINWTLSAISKAESSAEADTTVTRFPKTMREAGA